MRRPSGSDTTPALRPWLPWADAARSESPILIGSEPPPERTKRDYRVPNHPGEGFDLGGESVARRAALEVPDERALFAGGGLPVEVPHERPACQRASFVGGVLPGRHRLAASRPRFRRDRRPSMSRLRERDDPLSSVVPPFSTV